MSSILSIGAGGDTEFYDFPLEQSLRFNDGDAAYLSKTFGSAGNRKTWTWSAWVKRSEVSGANILFSAGTASSNQLRCYIGGGSNLNIDSYVSGVFAFQLYSSQVLRDPSAWYHVVFSFDTTQSTSSNRIKVYLNGEQITSFSTASYPSLNLDSFVSNTVVHYVGNSPDNYYFDGYLAEVNFIDGTALDASYFGETKSGIWIPKEYTGSYGTNGFRLTFEDDTTVEGFNTVLYDGNGATKSVGGVGFQPDFVWLKNRDSSYAHALVDSLRGATKSLSSNLTNAERTSDVTSLDSDGFSLQFVNATGTFSENQTNQGYVAWNWKAGGAPTTDNSAGQGNVPTAGSVKIDGSNSSSALTGTLVAKRISANTTRGFSIVTFNSGSTDNVTLDHGLGAVPKWIITRPSGNSGGWLVYHSDQAADPSLGYLQLNTTGAFTDDDRIWNDTMPTSTLVTLGNVSYNFGDNKECVMYCWSEISGYSKFGSYTGSGSTGKKITTGFKPAFVLVKSYDQTRNWIVWDNTRTTANPADGHLHPSANVAEQTGTDEIQFDSDGFTFLSGDADSNQSGYNYIYAAFADTREYAFWTDQSGNNNDFQHNSLEHTDVVPDNPTNNFATFSSIDSHVASGFSQTFGEGNLQVGATSGSHKQGVRSTIGTKTMNFYYELCSKTAGTTNYQIGVATSSAVVSSTSNDGIYNKAQSSGSSGDIIMVAYSADANAMWTGRNGTWDNGATVSEIEAGTTTNATQTSIDSDEHIHAMYLDQASSYSGTVVANFGQDGTFAGNKISQGNSDDNGNGDFFYAPPSGYFALCTNNLPNPGIDPSRGETPDEYFNTVLWTGDNTSPRSITGVGFQPDWTWIKRRDSAKDHGLFDSVRGSTKKLESNNTIVEIVGDNGKIDSFDTDGFTISTGTSDNSGVNSNSDTFVGWSWKAGGTAVSNTDGSITSSVSASPESGFSIVTYTGTGSNATVGHGLGVAPDMIMVKKRTNDTQAWQVYHSANTSAPETDKLTLNTNAATVDDNTTWNDTAPTSTVFSIGTGSGTNESTDTYVAYCFADIEGYGKFGGYTGNGSTDGSFIYTGFRPAFLIVKGVGQTNNWLMYDNKRSPFNIVDERISANLSNAEDDIDFCDFTSNGFKIRTTSHNGSGLDYVYIAFAEQPFKYANAR